MKLNFLAGSRVHEDINVRAGTGIAARDQPVQVKRLRAKRTDRIGIPLDSAYHSSRLICLFYLRGGRELK
jgi:hypothetical protein